MFETEPKLMTAKQKALIDDMNEFCRNKFYYNHQTTLQQAREYISQNINEYKLLTLDNWQINYL